MDRGCFEFLNETAAFGESIDWSAPGKGRLWRYNLHYFQYLFPSGGVLPNKVALRCMNDWVAQNPPGTPDAWDPFPISLRVVEWMKYLSLCGGRQGGVEWDEIARSIHAQVRWLERSLEFHLLGNHLFKNAKALLFAGIFFEGEDAERWKKRGVRLLRREIGEQILPDGGHFERSPMYHCMILGDCLDLLNVSLGSIDGKLQQLCAVLEPVAKRMVRFLVGMSHPDGDIALFNDAALGNEARPAELVGYVDRVLGERQSQSQRRTTEAQRNLTEEGR